MSLRKRDLGPAKNDPDWALELRAGKIAKSEFLAATADDPTCGATERPARARAAAGGMMESGNRGFATIGPRGPYAGTAYSRAEGADLLSVFRGACALRYDHPAWFQSQRMRCS